MANPQNITEWLQGLPIPWLASGPHGRADMGAQGAVYDSQVDQLRQATKARFPDTAPTDALQFIGNDRYQFQGPWEIDDDFRNRLLKSWNLWDLASTPAPLLIALWYMGLTNAYIVQQNGKWYQLGGAPDLDDPTSNLVIGDTGISPTGTPGPGGRVAGDPWWFFDDKDYFCSRFAIILDGWPVCTAAVEFDGTDTVASANWTRPFLSSDVIATSFTVITAGGPVVVSITSTSPSSVTVTASSAFVGTVQILAWVLGNNPFMDPRDSEIALLRKLVNIWKPAKATFMYAVTSFDGLLWGWPFGTKWGDSGLKWGMSGDYLRITP